jgi:hypothetical protein
MANRESVQFAEVVEDEHLPPQDVIWKVENGRAGTAISDMGFSRSQNPASSP